MILNVSHLPYLSSSRNSSTYKVIFVKLTRENLLCYLCQNFKFFSQCREHQRSLFMNERNENKQMDEAYEDKMKVTMRIFPNKLKVL